MDPWRQRYAVAYGSGGTTCATAGSASVAGWNFIERARLERELWDAFERGEPIEQLVEQCEPGFRRDVWSTTAVRIRKIERMMRDQGRPDRDPGS